jgi:predicted RNA-binding protein with PIN domain
VSGRVTVADRLEQLDARSWAQLLRTIRGVADGDGTLAAHLARPTSELAGGPPRRALCEALVAEQELVALLRADAGLPAAVHDAIADGEDAAGGADAGVADVGDGASDARPPAGQEDPRAAARMRELRRARDEERRRRDGAEARAAAAEVRAEEAVAAREQLAQRVEALEGELAVARDAVQQAAARAERRSAARIQELERDLASERSTLAGLRRDHERTRAELAAAAAELDGLRSLAVAAPPAGVAGPTTGPRPLVVPAGIEPDTTAAARWLADRARMLLVDGYNVVLTLRPGRALDEQRRWLVDRLRPLVPRGGPTPVVVWDGDGATGRMRDTGGVEVRFTPDGMTADDEIVFAVAATADPVLVVTDDVELRARVRAEGGNVVGTVHLLGIVEA